MQSVRCAACGSQLMNGATAVLLQSQRFPSIFLHAGPCQSVMRLAWELEKLPQGEFFHDLFSVESTPKAEHQKWWKVEQAWILSRIRNDWESTVQHFYRLMKCDRES